MGNFNTAIRFLPGAKRAPTLVDLTRPFLKRDNAQFLARVAQSLDKLSHTSWPGGVGVDRGGVACIGLIGEYGLIGYTIRRAQEVIRVDRTPSYWSHAFLAYSPLSTDPGVNRHPKRSGWIWESTLEPAVGFSSFVERNGVSVRRISDYTQASFDPFAAHCVPNIAILAIALTEEERKAILDRADDPNADQLRYDLAGLLGTWYAYITNPADRPNPLSAGSGVFSSAYVQLAYDAAGIDLAPGAHQRNTCPEHLWQAARRLGPMFRASDADGHRIERPVVGWYCIRDKACVAAPVDAEIPATLRDAMKQLERHKA